MIYRNTLILVSTLGTLCVSANDIPKEFVTSHFCVCQGNDFQIRQANVGELQGEWDFGESESEWAVTIIPHKEGMIVQTSSVFYSDELENFLCVYATVNNPKFSNGVFRIAKPHGEKGYYNAVLIESKSANPKSGKKTKMLLLDSNSLDSRKGARREAGFFSGTLKEEFGEQYAISCTILGEDKLKGKSAAELALIRNGIYARYGMIFSDLALKQHFAKQKWYRPWKTDVTDCITELEWINIRNIQKYEKLRKQE